MKIAVPNMQMSSIKNRCELCLFFLFISNYYCVLSKLSLKKRYVSKKNAFVDRIHCFQDIVYITFLERKKYFCQLRTNQTFKKEQQYSVEFKQFHPPPFPFQRISITSQREGEFWSSVWKNFFHFYTINKHKIRNLPKGPPFPPF